MEFSQYKDVPVVVYGNLEKYNEVLSKGRCRIFYKYMNRNGTYITDEFAEKLVSSLPYAPVKGIYDNFMEDYEGHGKERFEGKIYGVVPANPNFAWETHLDEDGVEREYACADVLLFTGIYKEASEILGKAQSMEIYEPSIKGEMMTIEGRKAFVFTDGCFGGLQVLGEDVEPCFEGAAFFSLYKSLSELIDTLTTYGQNLNDPESNEGGYIMPKFDFRLSDGEKYNMLFDLLNPNYNAEGEWDIDYILMDVYDDYAVAYSCKEGCHERVYYSKENDEVTIGEHAKCYIVDVTENELQALNTLQALNGGNYEKIDENFGSVVEFNEKFELSEQKIEELNASLSTLQTEKEEVATQYAAVNEQVEALTAEVNALNEYKLQVETNEKEVVIAKYAKRMSEDALAPFKEKIAEYSVEQLSKDLAFELVNTDPSIFELNTGNDGLIPKDTHEKSAMETLLDRYESR